MTALCYFNALRELGGARRIVEDEVRARLASYGTERRRLDPPDHPFADRRLREVLELTSRVSTDQVAQAKEALSKPCADEKLGVDVALATNMISVGLDIGRLGLMLVQGQPKTASEYIQAASRTGLAWSWSCSTPTSRATACTTRASATSKPASTAPWTGYGLYRQVVALGQPSFTRASSDEPPSSRRTYGLPLCHRYSEVHARLPRLGRNGAAAR